jgi:hypothetical protein
MSYQCHLGTGVVLGHYCSIWVVILGDFVTLEMEAVLLTRCIRIMHTVVSALY